jgi:hypothetical protein
VWLRVLTVLALVLLGAVTALVLVQDGADETTTPTAAPPTAAAPPTTPASTTTVPTTTAPGTVNTATAVWPTASSAARYTDPIAAAAGFAAFVGFDDPVIGEFMQGDTRSGEVEIRPTPSGPPTTVFVRQLEDGTWWVLGSATANIRLDSPTAGNLITTPTRLTGAANAYEGEGNVSVTIIEDDGVDPVAIANVTGAMGEMGAFDGEIEFLRFPTQKFGAILLTTASAEDGRLWEAAVVRVRFAPDV